MPIPNTEGCNSNLYLILFEHPNFAKNFNVRTLLLSLSPKFRKFSSCFYNIYNSSTMATAFYAVFFAVTSTTMTKEIFT